MSENEKGKKINRSRFISVITAMALVVITSFVSCTSSDSLKEIIQDSDTNQNAKGNTQSDDKVTIKKQVLWEVDGVKITATELDNDSYSGKSIKVTTENNSKKDIGIGINALIVNDYMFTDLTSIEVAAGKKSNDTIDLFSSDLKNAGIEKIGKIELYMHTFNPDTYETIKNSKCITIKTSEFDKMDTSTNIKGSEVYNKNGIKIVAQYVDEDSLWGKSVLMYIENNSKKNIIVQNDKLSVNGSMIESSFSSEIFKGKKCFDTIELFQDSLDENGIESVDSIETEFKILTENFDTIDKSGKVTIKTK